MGKFGLGVQNEAGQRLIEFCQENTLVRANHKDITKWSISKSDRLYSLQPKMEKFYTVSKNKKLTVVQIMSSLLQNSGLNRRK